jgi:peptide/nickel transport system substrate-binding protein
VIVSLTANGVSSAAPTSTVTVATTDLATSLDPATASTDPNVWYSDAVYETLVGYNQSKTKYTPELATSWSVNASGNAYIFTLRKGVVFHDGGTLSATGVRASLERTIAIGKGDSYLLNDISSITATSTYKLTIRLKTPNAAFLSDIEPIYIVSYKAIRQYGGTDLGQSWFSSHDAGSGPYELSQWTPNSSLVLKEFPKYWRGWSGNHVGTYDFVEADPATEVLDLSQGTADIIDSASLQDAKTLDSDTGLYHISNGNAAPFFMQFNLSSPVLSNVNIRKAIAEAIPYSQIISQVMLGFSQRLTGPDSNAMTDANTSLKPTPYDPSLSESLLAQAGYTPSHPLSLSLIYFNGLTYEQTLATIIQASLQTVGVNVTVQGLPGASYVAAAESGPTNRPDLALEEPEISSFDPGSYLYSLINPAQEGTLYYWGYNDESVIDLLNQALSSSSATKQATLYKQVQADLVSQYSSVWLATVPNQLVAHNDIHNLTVHPFDRGFNYYGVWKS